MQIEIPIHEFERLESKQKTLIEQYQEASQRFAVTTKGSWGGSAAKERAQQDIYLLQVRIEELSDLLQKCRVRQKEVDEKTVYVGSEIVILWIDEAVHYKIGVIADGSVPVISPFSPLGSILLDKKEKDIFIFDSPEGEVQLKILEVDNSQI